MTNDIHQRLGVRRVINATGTWTSFGSATVHEDVAVLIGKTLQSAFVIDDLQAAASRTIAAAFDVEAGYVTNCSAAGLSLCAAALIAGNDLYKIKRLPNADWAKKEILIQKGHAIDFGADVTQMLRLSGAVVVEVGASNWCEPEWLAPYINDRVAGAVFVRSHLCPQRNLIKLDQFSQILKQHQIPVVVDAAAEADISDLHKTGADIVIHSLQKYPQGPTAGIISGRASIMQAVAAQSCGLGRSIKAGKEAIAGAIITLERLASQDQLAARTRNTKRLQGMQGRLGAARGIATAIEPDPTGNPFDRLKIHVNEDQAGLSASELARRLLANDPVVAMRDSSAEFGDLFIDPRSLTDNEMTELCDILSSHLSKKDLA